MMCPLVLDLAHATINTGESYTISSQFPHIDNCGKWILDLFTIATLTWQHSSAESFSLVGCLERSLRRPSKSPASGGEAVSVGPGGPEVLNSASRLCELNRLFRCLSSSIHKRHMEQVSPRNQLLN